MANRKHHMPECLLTYYSQSVGGSVMDAYRHGQAVIIHADQPQVREETEEILAAERDLRAIQHEIDAAYWIFSRSASQGLGKLADPTLYARRNAARDHLMDLRRQARPQ